MVIARLVKNFLLIALACLLLLVCIANTGVVSLRIFPGFVVEFLGVNFEFSAPLFLIILASVFIGIVIGSVREWLREYGMRLEAARQRRRIVRLTREIETIRAQSDTSEQDDILARLEAPPKGR